MSLLPRSSSIILIAMEQKQSKPLVSMQIDSTDEETFLWVNHEVVKTYGPNQSQAARADAVMISDIISSISFHTQPKIFIDGDHHLPSQAAETIQ